MGTCCSVDIRFGGGYIIEEERGYHEKDDDDDDDNDDEESVEAVKRADYGATMRLRGASNTTSMYTRQGKKGVNQDSMTVWENFTGEKDAIFCGVFDGHGPSGHMISRHVRDHLPSKLSQSIKQLPTHASHKDHKQSNGNGHNHFFHSLESCLIESFKEVDEELGTDSAMDGYCSGTTSVNIIKKGEHLIVTNLGDSRAVLCSRGDKNQLVPIQLTVDLKPNIPSEAERIKNCKGRVFAMDEEPNVFRIWMPDEDCPGLAMARAFGDFCLKDYGLISVPEVSYRKLTSKDEFVVLATDGVWDVLTNYEVIRTVASAKNRSVAAKTLVNRAVRAWKNKYPGSKIDDCAAICLFLKNPPFLTKTKSMSDVSCNTLNKVELVSSHSCRSVKTNGDQDTIIGQLEDYSAHKRDVVVVHEKRNKHTQDQQVHRAIPGNKKSSKLQK